jgi:hypothetical protein
MIRDREGEAARMATIKFNWVDVKESPHIGQIPTAHWIFGDDKRTVKIPRENAVKLAESINAELGPRLLSSSGYPAEIDDEPISRQCTLLDGRTVQLDLTREAARTIVDEVLKKDVPGITAPG